MQIYVVTKIPTEHNHIISLDNLGRMSVLEHLIMKKLVIKVKTKEIKNHLRSKIKVITKDILNVKQNISSKQVNGRSQGEILSGMLNEQTRKDTNRT